MPIVQSCDFITLKSFESSAYNAISEELTTSGKSLIKIIKKKGPNMDPWGTPEDTGSQSE
jgi:hypothetical protein